MTDQLPAKAEKIRCDACPVMCFIAEGKSGACDRYANHGGDLIRLDPLTVIESGVPAVAFLGTGDAPSGWDGAFSLPASDTKNTTTIPTLVTCSKAVRCASSTAMVNVK